MQTLVIPDVHQKTDVVTSILEKELDKVDEVVFLGDWFDSFHEPPFVTSFTDTCAYLKSLILEHPQKDKFVFLVGNHDIGYIYQNGRRSEIRCFKGWYVPYACSGMTVSKITKFKKEFFKKGLKDDFFKKYFKAAYYTQDWILSHAGISPELIKQKEMYKETEFDKKVFIEETIHQAWQNFRDIMYIDNYLISAVGLARYGNSPVGGVFWCDWNYEFESSALLGKQICGHTEHHKPEVRFLETEKESWCIDTPERNYYGLINNGKFQLCTVDGSKASFKKKQKNVEHPF